MDSIFTLSDSHEYFCWKVRKVSSSEIFFEIILGKLTEDTVSACLSFSFSQDSITSAIISIALSSQVIMVARISSEPETYMVESQSFQFSFFIPSDEVELIETMISSFVLFAGSYNSYLFVRLAQCLVHSYGPNQKIY